MNPADLLNEAAAAHAPGCLFEDAGGSVQVVGPSDEVALLLELIGRASPGWVRPADSEQADGWTVGRWMIGYPYRRSTSPPKVRS